MDDLSPPRRVTLASASPRRRALLRAAGYAVRVAPLPPGGDDVEARPLPADLRPSEIVETLALRKWWAAAHHATATSDNTDDVILTADTLVFLHGEPLGKPTDDAHALAMLQRLAGHTHDVLSAVALGTPSGRPWWGHARTRVRFHALAPEILMAYVASGEPRGKAGAYGIQGGGASLVAGVVGDIDTVIGLPLRLVARLETGVRPRRVI